MWEEQLFDPPIQYKTNLLQVAQNKMLRMMNGSTLKDHITSESLLNKHNLLSANQLAAEIKITISLEFQNFELKNAWKFNLWKKINITVVKNPEKVLHTG